MRIQIAIAIAASLLASGANASSILVVDDAPVNASRSVMVIPDAPILRSFAHVLEPDQIAQVSRSVIAVGEPPAVSGERVAAINNNSGTSVMRGGVFGSALPTPVVETPPVKQLSRPALRKKERDERRAVRDAMRFGEPLPQKAESQPEAVQPAPDQNSGT